MRVHVNLSTIRMWYVRVLRVITRVLRTKHMYNGCYYSDTYSSHLTCMYMYMYMYVCHTVFLRFNINGCFSRFGVCNQPAVIFVMIVLWGTQLVVTLS